MWVRGLKQSKALQSQIPPCVAPHVGAWIETHTSEMFFNFVKVAPHVGAWIETTPPRIRKRVPHVAPHVGAWIETIQSITITNPSVCRTPCGCVD